MRKIYFSVFGSGIGHITRVHDIAEKLYQDGDEFLYSSFDEALDYLKKFGEKNILKSPSVDIFKWSESGGFSSSGSFLSFLFALPSFSQQVSFEMEHLSQFGPKIVISESRLSAIFAARLKSYPVITLLNQFKVLFPPRFQDGAVSRLFQRIEGNILGLFWSLSDKILMPDLPPPYTIGEANIAGNDVKGRVTFVGFMPPPHPTKEMLGNAKTALGIDSRPLVFIQISGPSATKERFVRDALRSTELLSKRFNIVVSMGYPNGSTEPRKLVNGAWIYEWCPVKDELFMLSDMIIGRSGHRTIEQCIDNGKPAVLVPVHNHSEQISNAEKFVKLGLGIEISQDEMNPQKLVESVDECLHDSKYNNNAKNMQLISRKYNGIERAVDAINSFL